MSDEDTIGGEDRQDFTADEDVLGVLGAEDRRAAEFRMAASPNSRRRSRSGRRALADWRKRFPRSCRQPKSGGGEDRLSASLAPRRERAGFWNSLAFWRPFAIASAGLAAGSMAGLVYLAQIPSLVAAAPRHAR